jgi:hypothetical protein
MKKKLLRCQNENVHIPCTDKNYVKGRFYVKSECIFNHICIHINIPLDLSAKLDAKILENELTGMNVYMKLEIIIVYDREPGSSVSIVTSYGLGDQGSIPERGGVFFLYPPCPADSGAHPASCTMGTGGSFPRSKVWLQHDADHPPPSSAEVKKEEQHLLSPQVPFTACSGSTLLF